MDFQVFHDYQRLVRRRQAQPIRCPDCEHHLGLIDLNNEPAFQCYWCGTTVRPGLDVYDQIRAAVDGFKR